MLWNSIIELIKVINKYLSKTVNSIDYLVVWIVILHFKFKNNVSN